MLTLTHILLIAGTMALLVAIGIASGRKVRDGQSFATGKGASGWMVGGTIMGTLIGGQSTIGTAQMAFVWGWSAWWFTIGTALGALVLALRFVRPLRRSGCVTLTEIVGREYGSPAERIGSILSLLGIFVSIIAQVLSSGAMMESLFGMPTIWGAVLSGIFIMIFVFFGGIYSAGAGGIVKMVLLYVSSIAAGVIVYRLADGFGGLEGAIGRRFSECGLLAEINGATTADAVHAKYGNLLARGATKDIGACISLILGVLCTQTYAQAVWSARSDRAARRGALLCVILTPLIGAACTMVGLYMRAHYITAYEAEALLSAGASLPQETGIIEGTAWVFTTFVMQHLPPWLGGIVLGTLFVTILGGGSGLILGASTIVGRDLFKRSGNTLAVYRTAVVVLTAAAVVAALTIRETLIVELGFLSLGLRATALLFPLCCALFFPGRFKPVAAVLSMSIGTVAMIAAYLLGLPLDPSFWGIGTGAVVMLCGWKRKERADVVAGDK